MTPPPPIPWIDYYRMLRSRIEHEDNLVTQRLSWFLASQAFLFSGFAIVLNAPMQSRFGSDIYVIYLRMIPMLGIAVGALIWLGIAAGIGAMAHVRKMARGRKELEGFPPLQGLRSTRFIGLAAPLLLPPLFVVVWITLLRYA